METIVATVKNVLLNNVELGGKLRLTLDKKIKGFKRNDDGTFEQADVDYINIQMTYQEYMASIRGEE